LGSRFRDLIARLSNPQLAEQLDLIKESQPSSAHGIGSDSGRVASMQGEPDVRRRPSAQRPQIQRRLVATQIEHLLRRYQAGVKVNDLAMEFSISRTTVMEHVRRAGAQRRRSRVIDHLDEARELHEHGHSIRALAERYGVHPDTVRYALRPTGRA